MDIYNTHLLDKEKKQKRIIRNCFICDFIPVWFLGALTVTPFGYKCPHLSNYSTSPKFVNSPVLIALCVLSAVITVAVFSDAAYHLCNDDMSFHEKLALFSYSCVTFTTALVYILAVAKTPLKRVELQGICEIVRETEKYGIRLLDEKLTKRVRIFYMSFFVVFGVVSVISTVAIIYQNQYDTDTLKENLQDQFFLMQGCVAIHYLILIFMFRSFFSRITDEVVAVLKLALLLRPHSSEIPEQLRLTNCESEYCKKYESNFNLEACLVRLRRFYLSIYYNHVETKKYLSPSVLVWILNNLAATSITAYSVVRCVIYGEVIDDKLSIHAVKATISLGVIWAYLIIMEDLAVVVGIYLLYFFKLFLRY